MVRLLQIIIFSIFSFFHLSAQLPANPIGSNPFSLKWKQINTDKVQVIFPQGIDSTAQRVANIAHYLWDKDDKSIGHKNNKVSILLHTLRVNPNGFVIVGPFRSEFYNIPEQFKNLASYPDQLAIHEYRHVQQFANSDQGITGLAKNIFGSWIWGGFAATAWPRWYWEGDAVIAETAQTLSGRGRFPTFNMEYHALLKDGITYSYEKAAAGSYKDFVPDWYNLGYHMLSYGREQYGEDIWGKVANEAVTYKGIFYPFAKSLKKHTQLSPANLYEKTLEHLQKEWQTIDGQKKDEGVILNDVEKSTVINYNSPLVISDKQILALKSGYNQLNELVSLHDQAGELTLTEIGLLPDREETVLQYNNGKVVWAEQGFHPRWRNETYSNLVIYDIQSRRKTRITDRTRYSSPSFSPEGRHLVAVSIDRTLQQSLVIIDTQTGTLMNTIYHSPGSELSFPRYLDEQRIVFIETKNQSNQVKLFNLQNRDINDISAPTNHHLGHLNVCEGRIVLTMADDYTHQIYELDPENGGLTPLTNSILGAYQPFIHGNKIYFSEFSAKGYNIKVREIENRKSQSARGSARFTNQPPFYPSLGNQKNENILAKIPDEKFAVKDYSRFSGLLDFHSLLPEWTPPTVSLSLLTDNTFGTLSGSIQGAYNYNEDEFQYGVGLTYAELYPVLNLSYFKADRSSIFYQFTQPADTTLIQTVFLERWNENRASAGFNVPYNFSKGNYSNQVSFSANYQNTGINLREASENRILNQDTIIGTVGQLTRFSSLITDPISNQTIHTLDLGFNLRMQKFIALQHLRSRFGWTLSARYRANIGDNTLGGNNFTARSFLYLPGILNNHSFSVEAMYMKEDLLSAYRYGDVFVYPRGYDFSLRRDNYLKLAFNYRFPIAYPDFAVGGFAFVKRLKGNVFFDYGRFGVSSFPFQKRYDQMSSVGFEMGLDFRALRLVEVDMGVRYSYLLNTDFTGGSPHQIDFFVISITE